LGLIGPVCGARILTQNIVSWVILKLPFDLARQELDRKVLTVFATVCSASVDGIYTQIKSVKPKVAKCVTARVLLYNILNVSEGQAASEMQWSVYAYRSTHIEVMNSVVAGDYEALNPSRLFVAIKPFSSAVEQSCVLTAEEHRAWEHTHPCEGSQHPAILRCGN